MNLSMRTHKQKKKYIQERINILDNTFLNCIRRRKTIKNTKLNRKIIFNGYKYIGNINF